MRKHTSIQHEIPERQADTNSASKTHGGLNLWRKAEKKILAAKKAHHVSRSTSLPYTGTHENDVNEYHIIRKLGQGAFATVYLAERQNRLVRAFSKVGAE